MKPYSVAIDGPAGAGKSTVARLLAKQLGFTYVDSGAMYRAVALKTHRLNVDTADADAVSAIARAARIVCLPAESAEEEQRILLDGEDVTGVIRTPAVASLASVVSAIPGVRTALVAQQQAFGLLGGIVMEGRDIGTVVLPHAELKIFLTASPEERATRRYQDIVQRAGKDPGMSATVTIAAVRADQDERDRRDASRSISPLVPAADAVYLNSDGKSPEQIVGEILALFHKRTKGVA